ncbi:universal stress protein [Mycolicibacterium palauense]|uniref:universal stress protein n=1 Tax=Mycolicibacterium palauense TaxID=2034511 RepID=UPI000BFEF55F|nr:universal stress protein [Mycolicibacterium palauense]
MTAQSEHTSHSRGIVVAVDGSPPSDAAVAWAARDAALRKLPLTLVHVLHPPMVMAWPETPVSPGFAEWHESQGAEVLKAATARAEDIVGSVAGDNPPEITSEMFTGPTMPTLIDLSKDAEMIVVGCRGMGAVGRTVLGSVSSSLIHHASCPVAVIHDETPPEDRTQAPVIVGIDGSPASEAATALAFEEASQRGVGLVAAHAWSDTIAIEYPGLSYPTMQGLGEEILGERLAGWQERYPDVEVRRAVACDKPAHQILDEAEKAQLVVVGSHGRGGFAGMLLGSVSTKVAHGAHVPVIVARQG